MVFRSYNFLNGYKHNHFIKVNRKWSKYLQKMDLTDIFFKNCLNWISVTPVVQTLVYRSSFWVYNVTKTNIRIGSDMFTRKRS